MSLFDVIKYQNIDLGNREGLLKLPEELLDIYWAYYCVQYEVLSPNTFNHNDRCSFLSFDNIYTSRSVLRIQLFNKALKEYNP